MKLGVAPQRRHHGSTAAVMAQDGTVTEEDIGMQTAEAAARAEDARQVTGSEQIDQA